LTYHYTKFINFLLLRSDLLAERFMKNMMPTFARMPAIDNETAQSVSRGHISLVANIILMRWNPTHLPHELIFTDHSLLVVINIERRLSKAGKLS
jgi:hypothetical protein